MALHLGIRLGSEILQEYEWQACDVILFWVLFPFTARLLSVGESAPKK
jgi:hypothetical protein